MKFFLVQLKWQFALLQKNSIISISFVVTLIYGLVLYFLRDAGSIDQVLVASVLNDPSVIGYFFIALAIYTEIKYQIMPAMMVTPLDVHHFLITRTIAITVIGVVCALGLALAIKGFDFPILSYTIGTMGICLMSALLGVLMLYFSDEFLKFTMLSVPVFLIFINLPLLQYLGGMEIGFFKYLFPIQGSLDLIDYAISGTVINHWYSYSSILFCVPIFYFFAYRSFNKKLKLQ